MSNRGIITPITDDSKLIVLLTIVNGLAHFSGRKINEIISVNNPIECRQYYLNGLWCELATTMFSLSVNLSTNLKDLSRDFGSM